MTIDLHFNINSQNFLRRTDTNAIIARSTEYICHFTFENEEWDTANKFVEFACSKKKTYVGVLGEGLECTTTIPSVAFDSCVIKVSVYTEDLATNQVSLIIIPSGYTSEYTESTEIGFTDVFVDAYNRIADNFDNAIIRDNHIVFFANGNEVLELSFDDVLTNQSQSDWEENNPESSHYIFNKPDIINNFQYTNDNLICLSDDRIVQTVSLKHHHKTEDITDFDHDVDIDLNELLERLTENIRSS